MPGRPGAATNTRRAQTPGDDNVLLLEECPATPPYNILRTGENSYRISLAVAGFKPDQISVTVQQNTLVVTGRESQKPGHDYVHRGIASRAQAPGCGSRASQIVC